jgi:hypothetical protein
VHDKISEVSSLLTSGSRDIGTWYCETCNNCGMDGGWGATYCNDYWRTTRLDYKTIGSDWAVDGRWWQYRDTTKQLLNDVADMLTRNRNHMAYSWCNSHNCQDCCHVGDYAQQLYVPKRCLVQHCKSGSCVITEMVATDVTPARWNACNFFNGFLSIVVAFVPGGGMITGAVSMACEWPKRRDLATDSLVNGRMQWPNGTVSDVNLISAADLSNSTLLAYINSNGTILP